MSHISLVNHLLFNKSFTNYSSLQVPLLYFWLPVFLNTVVVRKQVGSHGTRTCIKRQKIAYGKFLIFGQMNIYIKGFQKMKIRPLKGFEKIEFENFTL